MSNAKLNRNPPFAGYIRARACHPTTTVLLAISVAMALGPCPSLGDTAPDTTLANAKVGDHLDAAPFAVAIGPDMAGKAYGARWGEPRKIRRIEVAFDSAEAPPAKESVRIQYWHLKTRDGWDGKSEPVEAEIGACEAGWNDPVDDWTRGEWKDADARIGVNGNAWTITFTSTAEKEFPAAGTAGVAYRKTLKIRLLADAVLPKLQRFRVFTESVYCPLTARILWDKPAAAALQFEGDNTGRLDIFNGIVLAVRPWKVGNVQMGKDGQWAIPAGKTGGIEADLLMAVDPVNERNDRTVVTVRTKQNPFSFAAVDVARDLGGRVLVDDLGAMVVRGDDAIDSVEAGRKAHQQFRGKTVYDRVFDEPEQNLSRAWNDMPLKRPIWYGHGLPGNRNGIQQEVNGQINVFNSERWFSLPRSEKDSARKGWAGDFLRLDFGFPGDDRRGGRDLAEGYLPLLRTWWTDGPLYYEQSTILDKLDPNLDDIRLDDPTVLLMRIRIVNTSGASSGIARLHFTSSHGGKGETIVESLSADGDQVVAAASDKPRFRYLLRTQGQGVVQQADHAVDWSMELAPGKAHELEIAVPSITLDKPAEIDSLRKRGFNTRSREICDFWKRLGATATRIQTPEPWLNDFYKAVLQHLEIDCVRDIAAPRRYPRLSPFRYGIYLNESVMMMSDLDRRGCHKAAEECLQTFLDFQGTQAMEGNFKTLDGVFFGSGGYTNTGYTKSHGCMMWGMAEHWRLARNRDWMTQAAPKLVKACDWVTRERQATMTQNPDGSRPIEYGFLPTGRLEDVRDYWYWMATNVNTVWGFDALADALADFGHPEAPRLQRDAKAYHDDVMRGLTEARIRTSVVRLRDGTYVPKYPSHLHDRGRSQGWIRETLEGSIFLLIDGLIPPDAPEARWILKDYEDNLYISDRYGYSIPVFDDFWFSRGGFSMQANLLEGPLPYLYRDEIKHFLRAYFNGFASGFYPEVRGLNEHSRPELGYPFGDYFKSSDESNVTTWLRLMFVREDGKDLYLGQAIPRYWLAKGQRIGIERATSHFGPLSFWIEPATDAGEIHATVVPPERNRPDSIYVRIRHPQGKPIRAVVLNGKDYGRFDPEKEWVVLPGDVQGAQEIVARY